MLACINTPWGIRRYFKYIMRILVVSFILFFVIFPSYGQFTSVEELTKYIPSKTVKQIHTDLVALALDAKSDKPISIKFSVLEYTDNSYDIFFIAKKVNNEWIETKRKFVPIEQGTNVIYSLDRRSSFRKYIDKLGLRNSGEKEAHVILLNSLAERDYKYVSIGSATDIIAVKDLRFENGKIETDLVQPYVKPKKNHTFWKSFKINDSNIWEWFKIGFYSIIGLFGLAALTIILVKLLKKISQM